MNRNLPEEDFVIKEVHVPLLEENFKFLIHPIYALDFLRLNLLLFCRVSLCTLSFIFSISSSCVS